MEKKNDSSLIKDNTIFFINHFTEYTSKAVLALCLKKTSKKKSSENEVLSLFVAEMLERLNKKSLIHESKNTAEFDQFIFRSYIKNYFLSVAYELAASYEEQLGLLKPSDDGLIRFAHYIAECSIAILKKTYNLDAFIHQDKDSLVKPSLKSIFVAAAVTIQVKFNKHKHLSLTSGSDIPISKFLSALGLRHQTRASDGSDRIYYRYYIPAKKKSENIIYGYRNSIYNEIIDETIFSPVKAFNELAMHHSNIIFATLDDINNYLKSHIYNEFEFFEFKFDRFLDYMSSTYSKESGDLIVYCTHLNFQNFDMSRAKFDGVIFNRCNFNNANLTQASFNGCAIFDSEFQGTLFSATQFNKSKLNFIDLSRTKFGTDNTFSNSKMQFANLEGLYLNNANFNYVDLMGSNHIETNFSGANTVSLSSTGSISVSTCLGEQPVAQEMSLIENFSFMPYLVRQVSFCSDTASLMNVLFSNESTSKHDDFIKVDPSMLSVLAYGVYAIGESNQVLNLSLYSGDKTNRKNAANFFFDALSAIEKIDISAKSSSVDKLLNIDHEKFISGISDKSTEQIDEYATILAQEIFSYDRVNFTALKFYELMQEALNTKEKKPSPNFAALLMFSEKLYYRVNQEISGADGSSRLKVLQLYMYTAIKLCNAPYMDLQSASLIIQALSRNPLKHIELSAKDNKLLGQLMEYISPLENFHNLRQLECEQSIPFLPILTRDILMSMESNKKSYLDQILSLGSIQQKLLTQQIHVNEIKEASSQMNLLSDFVSIINKISSDEVRLFFNPEDVEHAVTFNETNKIECLSSRSSTRNKRRLSIRELPKFFGRKEEPSKDEPLNDTPVKQADVESEPISSPEKSSGTASL